MERACTYTTSMGDKISAVCLGFFTEGSAEEGLETAALLQFPNGTVTSVSIKKITMKGVPFSDLMRYTELSEKSKMFLELEEGTPVSIPSTGGKVQASFVSYTPLSRQPFTVKLDNGEVITVYRLWLGSELYMGDVL